MQSSRRPLDYNSLKGKRLIVVGTGGGGSGARMVKPTARAKDLGMEIILLDTKDSSVREMADEFIETDVTSFESCKQVIANLPDSLAVDGIVTFVEERTIVVAELQEHFGYPGHSVAASKAARDKLSMRVLLEHHGLPNPRYAYIDSRDAAAKLASWFPVPAFLKVSDGGGSIGSRTIHSSGAFVQEFDQAQWEINNVVPYDIKRSILASYEEDKPNFLIEEYLGPSERLAKSGHGRVTIELLIENSVVRFFAIADAKCFSSTDHRFNTLVFPSELNAVDVEALRNLCSRVVLKFGFRNGPLIVDAVVTESGPQIYEINSRIDSSLVLPLIEAAYNINMIDLTLEIAVGEPLNIGQQVEAATKVALAHFVMAKERSRLAKLENASCRGNTQKCKVTVLKGKGDYVAGPEAAYDCIVIVEILAQSRSEAESELQFFLSDLRLELEPVANGDF